jgi:hypothetical protein
LNTWHALYIDKRRYYKITIARFNPDYLGFSLL